MYVDLYVLKQGRNFFMVSFSRQAASKTISATEAQKVNKQQMNKQEPSKHVGGTTIMADRYYVQRLTEQVFLIRERISADAEPGSDDPIVRSFDVRHDAYVFVGNMNDKQRKLDEDHGQWTQRPV
jgi:hypothetical protein